MLMTKSKQGRDVVAGVLMMLCITALAATPAVASEPMPRLTTHNSQWINSPALSSENLRGKVVVVEFWTYGCINCLRALPYVKAWSEKFRDENFVVIGVHTPEFAREKDKSNVLAAVEDLGISYPVVMDNNYAIWNSYNNRYWPALYLIDAQGQIRYQHMGEGAYQETESMIKTLLVEASPGSNASKR